MNGKNEIAAAVDVVAVVAAVVAAAVVAAVVAAADFVVGERSDIAKQKEEEAVMKNDSGVDIAGVDAYIADYVVADYVVAVVAALMDNESYDIEHDYDEKD